MTAAHWSPADLHQQRLIVRQLALRSEQGRRNLGAARNVFAVRLRSVAASPLVLGGCFVVGFLLLRPTTQKRGAATVSRLTRRARSVAASVVWLMQLYRQFKSGIAAGTALTARRRTVADGSFGDPFEET